MLMTLSTSSSPSNGEQQFRKQLELLSRPGILTGYLIVKEQGTLSQTNLFHALWEKFRGVCGFRNLTNNRLVEFKTLQFLEEGRKWIKSQHDIERVKILASRVGLTSATEDDHKELRQLINEICCSSLENKEGQAHDLPNQFFNRYIKELKPFSKNITKACGIFDQVFSPNTLVSLNIQPSEKNVTEGDKERENEGRLNSSSQQDSGQVPEISEKDTEKDNVSQEESIQEKQPFSQPPSVSLKEEPTQETTKRDKENDENHLERIVDSWSSFIPRLYRNLTQLYSNEERDEDNLGNPFPDIKLENINEDNIETVFVKTCREKILRFYKTELDRYSQIISIQIDELGGYEQSKKRYRQILKSETKKLEKVINSMIRKITLENFEEPQNEIITKFKELTFEKISNLERLETENFNNLQKEEREQRIENEKAQEAIKKQQEERERKFQEEDNRKIQQKEEKRIQKEAELVNLMRKRIEKEENKQAIKKEITYKLANCKGEDLIIAQFQSKLYEDLEDKIKWISSLPNNLLDMDDNNFSHNSEKYFLKDLICDFETVAEITYSEMNTPAVAKEKLTILDNLKKSLEIHLGITQLEHTQFPPIGISNFNGYNCFFNSALQVIVHSQLLDYPFMLSSDTSTKEVFSLIQKLRKGESLNKNEIDRIKKYLGMELNSRPGETSGVLSSFSVKLKVPNQFHINLEMPLWLNENKDDYLLNNWNVLVAGSGDHLWTYVCDDKMTITQINDSRLNNPSYTKSKKKFNEHYNFSRVDVNSPERRDFKNRQIRYPVIHYKSRKYIEKNNF